jgi:Rod binding domain-containing protein
MGFLNPTDRSDLQTPEKAGQAMESMLLQRMLAGAHLTGKSKAPGAGMHADLFVEALADAVSKSGGLGIAKTLNQQTKAEAGGSHDDSENKSKKTSAANPAETGADLETQLLTRHRRLIGTTGRTDNSLGEP